MHWSLLDYQFKWIHLPLNLQRCSLDDKYGHLSKNPLETVSSGQFCSDCAMGGGGCSSRAPGAGLGSGVFSVSTPSLIFSACSVKPGQLKSDSLL